MSTHEMARWRCKLDAAFWEEGSRSASSDAGRQQKHIEARRGDVGEGMGAAVFSV
jgi:hypothetical protein